MPTREAWCPVMRTMLVAAAVAVVLSSAPLCASMITPVLTSASPVQMGPQLYTKTNWSGYAAESNFSSPQADSVTAVGALWIVPKATARTSPSGQLPDFVAWVGIDGFDNNTVEQVGTEAYTFDGTSFYYDAWYEMYPGDMYSMFGVSPGDSITASVQYGLPNNPNGFQLSLTDNTKQKSFSLSETSSAALRTSAEWIAEAPTGSHGILPLPQFGSVTFTNAWATINSTTGAICDPTWQAAQINMNNPAWGDAMTPSVFTTTGSGASAQSSFTVVQTPEPSTLAGLACAAATLGLHMRFRRRPEMRRLK